MNTYRPFMVITLIGILLLVAHFFKLTEPLVSAYMIIAEPVLAQESKSTKRAVSLVSILASIRDLARENAELRAKNQSLEAEIAKLKEVSHENQVLRQELKFTQESKDDYLPAQLIGRSSTGIIKDLIIDRGSRDNVIAGQPVLAQGYLIGRISSVSSTSSTVTLLTHPRSLVPIVLQNSRSTGILKGGISGLTAADILVDAAAQQGEMVVTSGLGGELPAGIPIGKLVEVLTQRGDITKKATVTSPIDVTKLEIVFIQKAQP